MNLRLPVVIAALFALVMTYLSPASAASGVESASVRYDKWGFGVKIPTPFARYSDSDQPAGGLSEIFVSGSLAYLVKVIPVVPDVRTSTAIELALQAEMKSAGKKDNARRWETLSNSGGREPFKGVIRIVRVKKADVSKSPYLRDVTRNDKCMRCVCMAPVSDDFSSIICIGVIGPENRAKDIQKAATALALGLTRFGSRSETVTAQRADLDKGCIELFGVLKSINADGKTLIMTVDRIRMPGMDPQPLDPSRTKTIYVNSLPKTIQEGLRVSVIGINTGVGKPMNADSVMLGE